MKKIATRKTESLKEKRVNYLQDFIEFIQSQGVVSLAIGVVMGTSVTKIVTALVIDIINPIVGIFIGGVDLEAFYFQIANAKIMWGSFINSFIDFVIVALVVYFSIKVLGLNKSKQKS